MSVDQKQVEKVMTKLYNVQAEIVRGVALRALSEIEVSTPVKTGRARSNWNISSGTPNYTVKPPTGTEENPEKPKNQQSTIADAPVDKTIYISNGLPYIKPLNEGTSKQAPGMFVETAVKLAIRNAKRAFKRGSA